MLPRFCGIFLLIVTTSQFAVAEKKWSIKNVEIDARVDSAGYLFIEEKRTYQFWGKFTYAFYELSLAGLLGVDQIHLLENGVPYQPSEDKSPGTFWVKRDVKQMTVQWYFRNEADRARYHGEIREFTLRFRVLGAVRVHNDVAELYYKFIGTGWDRASENVRVTIRLPGPPLADDVKAWAHGPLHGQIVREPHGSITMPIAHLPPKKFWEARIVFPVHYLPQAAAALRDDRDALAAILQEEAQWAEAANRVRQEALARRRWQIANTERYWPGLLALNGAGIIFLLYMYRHHGRSLRRQRSAMDSTPPTDMPPAIANYIFNLHHLTGGALLATIFDLANRGYVQLRQEKITSRFLGITSTKLEVTILFDEEKLSLAHAELLPFERELLDFLRSALAQNRQQLSFAEIKKQSSKFLIFFKRWRKAVAAQAGNPQLYDAASVRASFITLGIWLLLIAANAFGCYAMGKTAIPLLMVSIIFASLSFVILRYKTEVAEKLDRLHAFRRYLKRFPQTYQQYGVNWQHADKFLIYGAALGLSGTDIKPLIGIMEKEHAGYVFPWFIYGDTSSPSSLAPAIASLIEVGGTVLSSASGAGGGASSDGGGGAGGSGGGAG